MLITCDSCPPGAKGNGGGGGPVYNQYRTYGHWIEHLTSQSHQQNIKGLLPHWKRSKDKNSFVVRFKRHPNSNSRPPDALDVVKYFSEFGMIAQFYYDEVNNKFCVITIDPPNIGQIAIENVEGHKIYGCPLEILERGLISKNEWDSLLKSVGISVTRSPPESVENVQDQHKDVHPTATATIRNSAAATSISSAGGGGSSTSLPSSNKNKVKSKPSQVYYNSAMVAQSSQARTPIATPSGGGSARSLNNNSTPSTANNSKSGSVTDVLENVPTKKKSRSKKSKKKSKDKTNKEDSNHVVEAQGSFGVLPIKKVIQIIQPQRVPDESDSISLQSVQKQQTINSIVSQFQGTNISAKNPNEMQFRGGYNPNPQIHSATPTSEEVTKSTDSDGGSSASSKKSHPGTSSLPNQQKQQHHHDQKVHNVAPIRPQLSQRIPFHHARHPTAPYPATSTSFTPVQFSTMIQQQAQVYLQNGDPNPFMNLPPPPQDSGRHRSAATSNPSVRSKNPLGKLGLQLEQQIQIMDANNRAQTQHHLLQQQQLQQTPVSMSSINPGHSQHSQPQPMVMIHKPITGIVEPQMAQIPQMFHIGHGQMAYQQQQQRVQQQIASSRQQQQQPQHSPQFRAGPSEYKMFFYKLLTADSGQFPKLQNYQNFIRLNLDAQLREFLNSMSLDKDAIEKRNLVLTDLRHILRQPQHYPQCEIYPFGSFLTGLGDFTSDVDVYVDAYGINKGNPLPSNDITTMDILNKVLRILRRAKCRQSNKVFCKEINPIKNARVPIIKIQHSFTLVNLDLSFENLISLRNSEMIKLYMMLHPVVGPLLIVIRFWAKFHSLTGSTSIKNYGLILMVLVFLKRKGIIPSVFELQRLKLKERIISSSKESSVADVIEGWDTSFSTNVDEIRATFPSSLPIEVAERNFLKVLLTLALEFFELYAKENLANLVVCSYTSELIKRDSFFPGNEEELPESLDRYKERCYAKNGERRLNVRTPMCIQDPFILSFNVGGVTPPNVALKFQVACRETATIIKKEFDSFSFVQLFSSLPGELSDRKFLTACDRHKKTLEIKKEIDFQLNGDMAKADPEKTEMPPLYLLSLEQITSKETVRFGKGFESLITFEPESDFQNLFAHEIIRFKISEVQSPSYLLSKLKTLWISFVRDFFSEFFQAFNLDVVKEDYTVNERAYADLPFQEKTRRNHEMIFTGGVKKRSKNSSKNELTGDEFNDRQSTLKEKIKELGALEEFATFAKFTCTTYSEVWERRGQLYSQITRSLPKISETNTDKQKAEEPKRSRSKPNKSKDKESKDFDRLLYNPIDIEKQITNLVIQEKQKEKKNGKPVLMFQVYLKFDCRLVDDLPMLHVIFSQHGKCTQNYKAGASTIHENLKDDLPWYILHRTREWLMLDTEASSSAGDPLSPKSVEDTQENGETVDEDYELLIPPSSSSSCSSPNAAGSIAEDEDE